MARGPGHEGWAEAWHDIWTSPLNPAYREVTLLYDQVLEALASPNE